jgi:hypothetical protein
LCTFLPQVHFQNAFATRKPLSFKELLVGREGFEPSTIGLKVRCSTN